MQERKAYLGNPFENLIIGAIKVRPSKQIITLT